MAIDFELLDRIIKGIESGELEHQQEAWHCGTAHCIAGWVAVIEGRKMGFYYNSRTELFCCIKKKFDINNLPNFLRTGLTNEYSVKTWLQFPFYFAQNALRLTKDQAYYLFDKYNKLEDIKRIRNQFWEEENAIK